VVYFHRHTARPLAVSAFALRPVAPLARDTGGGGLRSALATHHAGEAGGRWRTCSEMASCVLEPGWGACTCTVRAGPCVTMSLAAGGEVEVGGCGAAVQVQADAPLTGGGVHHHTRPSPTSPELHQRHHHPPPLHMPHLRRGPGLQEPLRPLPWYTCVS
jgi:hypothetical protein